MDASATAGRIKDPLPMGCLHRGTPAVFANSLYFKGAWEHKFDTYLTRDEAFFLHDGCIVRVPFMSSTSKQCIACRPGYKVRASTGCSRCTSTFWTRTTACRRCCTS